MIDLNLIKKELHDTENTSDTEMIQNLSGSELREDGCKSENTGS